MDQRMELPTTAADDRTPLSGRRASPPLLLVRLFLASGAFQLFSDFSTYTSEQGTRRGGFRRRDGKEGATLRLKVFHQGWVQLPPELLAKEGIRAGDLAEVSVSRAGEGGGPFLP